MTSNRISPRYQHQMSAQRIAGASHGGLPGQALAADYSKDRPVTLRAGFVRMVTSNSSLEASVFLPGRAIVAAPGLFPSARGRACKPSTVQSLGHQYAIDRVADVARIHVSSLSSSAVSVGIDPNENGLTHAQIPFAPGAKTYD